MGKRILVVGEERDADEVLRRSLETAGYEVLMAHSAEEAGQMVDGDGAEDSPFDLLLLDVMMPGMSGRDLAERLKRVRAVLQQTVPVTDGGEGLTLHGGTKTAIVDGKETMLTRTEYALLQLLMGKPDHVFSRQELLEQVWPGNVIVNARTVDVNIARLRKKLGRYARNIANKQCFGYYYKIND